MEDVNEALADMGREMAEEKVDQLAVKEALPMEKEDYIEKEAEIFTSALTEKYNAVIKQMEIASAILSEELQHLPDEERKRYEGELLEATKKLEEAKDISQEIGESTFQAFLGIKDPTLVWIYNVGYKTQQENKLEEAEGIFQTLVLLSPMVRDYWMALGFVQRDREVYERAIESFSFASLLDPEHAPSRYQSAKVYLHQGEFEDALAELAVLEKIIKEQKLEDLKQIGRAHV